MAYFTDDGNWYYTAIHCNTSWGGADESVTSHLSIPLARSGYNAASPRGINIMFEFPKASISPSTYYFSITSGGWWGITSTSSPTGTMSRSGSTYSFSKSTKDIGIYEVQSSGTAWGRVLFQTKNKVNPAGTTIDFNVSKNYVTKATNWTTSASTFATERGYIPHKTSTYTNGLWGARCYTSNTANLFSYILSLSDSSTTNKYKFLNIGSNYLEIRFYVGSRGTEVVTINPGDTFYVSYRRSWSQSGSPARWTYNATTTVYCYKNDSLVASSSQTNSSSSSSVSYPSDYEYIYARTNASTENGLGIIYIGKI